jgi:ribosomal protein S18 acetylase RimI-like enzyme
MTKVGIRRARPEDLDAAVGVWERARWDAQQPWLEERMKYSHEGNLRHFRDVVMHENEVWLAVEDDAVVGLLALGEHKVDQLHVEPRCQGRGVGTALLDRAKQLSPEGLTLFTHQRNDRARAFYERRGFRAVQFGVSPPPESEPGVKYAWDSTEIG